MADEHSTGRARRDKDIHSTSKAARGRNNDTHTTGKASRGTDNVPRPYDRNKASADIRRKMLQGEAKASANDWPKEFILNGVKYKNEGILSDSSGEAVVFTVTNGGRKYALKIYYYDPDHRPNHELSLIHI